ncbi:hypothetical protein GBA52_003795 [Prunus armeniaca]|nr:hypothetical protein GBA52_003795 [Prunus armeniaca]
MVCSFTIQLCVKTKILCCLTTTALAIKTQSTENSVSQSYLPDTIVLQIYIITFLLLKFLCLQAEGAARRAEEVGFVDLDHFPELPMPEILHGLQRYWQPVTVILRCPCFPVAAPCVYGARRIHSPILPTYVHM